MCIFIEIDNMNINAEKFEDMAVTSICKKLKATHYLSGESARNYILDSEFSDQNIELEYQEYQHPEYPQRYEGFVPFLSTIDLLFNCGEKSLGILKQPVPHCN